MADNARVCEIEGVEPLGFTDMTGERKREKELACMYHEAHTAGLSDIHSCSQISIMSAAMRRYSSPIASPSLSLCANINLARSCPSGDKEARR